MLKRETFPVANIYVPTARRKTLDLKRVDAIAHSMLSEGQQTPILVRADGARFVLVERLHGSRPPRRWARSPSSVTASTPGSIRRRRPGTTATRNADWEKNSHRL
jgi:hypothetical protein